MASDAGGHVIKIAELPGGENACERTIEAGSGDIVVVPAGTPHKFVSRGTTHRQVSIHPVAQMETEWLE
jgi:mannose-6-phosphate isomerase-like protein (cupin superfamily)